MTPRPPVIALADANPVHLDLLRAILTDEGYQTLSCRSQLETYVRVVLDPPDLLIVGLHLEQRDSGLRLVRKLRQNTRTCDLPILLCSADVRFLRERADYLERLGCAVLEKPFDLDELLATVAKLLRHRAAGPAAGPLIAGTPGQR